MWKDSIVLQAEWDSSPYLDKYSTLFQWNVSQKVRFKRIKCSGVTEITAGRSVTDPTCFYGALMVSSPDFGTAVNNITLHDSYGGPLIAGHTNTVIYFTIQSGRTNLSTATSGGIVFNDFEDVDITFDAKENDILSFAVKNTDPYGGEGYVKWRGGICVEMDVFY